MLRLIPLYKAALVLFWGRPILTNTWDIHNVHVYIHVYAIIVCITSIMNARMCVCTQAFWNKEGNIIEKHGRQQKVKMI